MRRRITAASRSIRHALGLRLAQQRNRQARFRHELAVCAIFKDEASYLEEWLTFHHGVGVEHFFLYDDASSDGWRDVVEPWIRRGLVTVIDWAGGLQVPAYDHCVRRYRRRARWLAFIDVDEFLFSPKCLDVREVLRDYADLPALFVYWVLFGSSGHVSRPAGSVIESYTRCLDPVSAGRDDFDHRDSPGRENYVTGWAKDGKSIVNPRWVRRCNAHRPKELWRGELLDENRRPPSRRGTESTLSHSVLRINHYWSKSLEELREKVEKGNVYDKRPYRNLESWLAREQALNASEDTTILPVWKAIRAVP